MLWAFYQTKSQFELVYNVLASHIYGKVNDRQCYSGLKGITLFKEAILTCLTTVGRLLKPVVKNFYLQCTSV